MAKFEMELPKEIMADFEKIHGNTEKIFGGMTKAGAEVVRDNLKTGVPASIRNSNMMNCLKISRTYKTPSDDGINTQVMFDGYFTNHLGVKTPAPLVANVFEYGKHGQPARPFFRKAFTKSKIEKAMLQAQKELSGGLLDE